jgi:GTP-binding protein
LVMDARRPLTPFDQMMLDWCVNVNLPTQIILTKTCKDHLITLIWWCAFE